MEKEAYFPWNLLGTGAFRAQKNKEIVYHNINKPTLNL